MNNIAPPSQIATPFTSFFDLFIIQYSQSLSKYKRGHQASHSSDSSSSDDDASDSSSSIGDEGPDWISNGQGREWRIEVGRQLQEALDEAIVAGAKDEEIQLHREIGVFQNFIQLNYFEALEITPDVTSEYIRSEIIRAANDFSQCIGDIDSFPPSRPSSPLSTDLASVFGSSSPKKLKKVLKLKKFAKALTAIEVGMPIRRATFMYEVNRKIIKNRRTELRTRMKYLKNRQFLSFAEKTTLLRFVNQCCVGVSA